jgi:hypothetical protein
MLILNHLYYNSQKNYQNIIIRPIKHVNLKASISNFKRRFQFIFIFIIIFRLLMKLFTFAFVK